VGTAKVERACSYKSVPPLSTHEYSARGYFYVEKSGIVDEGDRIFFITFRHDSENLAYIGWRKIDGVNRWILTTRNGNRIRDTYRTSMDLPSVGTWYGVELSWLDGTVSPELLRLLYTSKYMSQMATKIP